MAELVGAVRAAVVGPPPVVVGADEGVELLLFWEVGVGAVHEVLRRKRRNGNSARETCVKSKTSISVLSRTDRSWQQGQLLL